MNKKITILVVILSLILLCLIVYLVIHYSSDDTVNVYDYYSGEQREDVDGQEMIYLWDEDNMPSETIYTENDGDYYDDPGFRPYLTVYDVEDNMDVKGAVLVSPGGVFLFRSEIQEGTNVAEEFARRGYVSFIVHYRVNPYTEEESGIDISRAIKYVRSQADSYGYQPDNITVVGFSAGGIANGHAVLEFGHGEDGRVIDDDYQVDRLDEVDGMPNAVIMGYSFYGRLSVADLDEDTFKDFDLPPTFYVYGTEDPFYNQFESQVDLLEGLNKNIDSLVLDNYPHGFGIGGDWAEDAVTFLEGSF